MKPHRPLAGRPAHRPTPRLTGAGLMLVAALVASPSPAATGVAATLNLQTTAQAGGKAVTDAQAAAWGTVYDGLRSTVGAAVQVGETDPDGVTSATTSGYATADWQNHGADSGTVEFQMGWSMQVRDQAASGWLGQASPSFTYTFIAGADEVLNLDYASGGVIGWNTVLAGGPEGTRSFATALQTGHLSAALTAGSTYTLSLLTTDPTLGGAGSSDTTFNWSISAVPEAPAWALMLAGLLVTTGWQRRRQGR